MDGKKSNCVSEFIGKHGKIKVKEMEVLGFIGSHQLAPLIKKDLQEVRQCLEFLRGYAGNICTYITEACECGS